MNPYDEGEKAFYDGRSPDDNPYHENDPKRDEWDDGYMGADVYESGHS